MTPEQRRALAYKTAQEWSGNDDGPPSLVHAIKDALDKQEELHEAELQAERPCCGDFFTCKKACVMRGRELEKRENAAAVAEALEKRDRDWILAMGHALGLDSGYKVPIVPEVAPFKELFDSLKPRTDLVCKHEHTDVSQPNMDDADYRVECKDCGKVWWHDGPDS